MIGRVDFAASLAANGGYVEIDAMPEDLRELLAEGGVDERALEEIAGDDHVIRGDEDWSRLFARLDRAGHDDTARAFVGRAFEALAAKVDENRARAAREGGLRFAGDPELDAVCRGTHTLGPGDSGEPVRRVQQALADLGLFDPASVHGRFDAATRDGVARFQREAGIRIDGVVGAETLGALAATAPPPGQVHPRGPSYDQLLRDGRLDVTIALGDGASAFAATTEREVLSGLRAQGYHRVTSSAERARLGLDGDRFDPDALYFARTVHDAASDRDVDVVVRLVLPSDEPRAAQTSLARALRQDEVVLFTGRGDTPTDRDLPLPGDAAERARPTQGLRASLGHTRERDARPEHQVVVVDAGHAEARVAPLRTGLGRGTSAFITSVRPGRVAAHADRVLSFLEGLLQRAPNHAMLTAQGTVDQQSLRALGLDALASTASHRFAESGFLGRARSC
ncbi:peptidoglycan-binding protein [Myxococcota bacterium]|nr:peptidoglycan-binding protein [Myxococcota bacterium]